MDYFSCKKIIDVLVLYFKAMFLSWVKVRKKDFCIILAEKQQKCCDRAPLKLFKALVLARWESKNRNQLGPVFQKPINVNPRLKIYKGVYFSTPKYCSTLIFGKTLHYKKPILKNINKQNKFSLNS